MEVKHNLMKVLAFKDFPMGLGLFDNNVDNFHFHFQNNHFCTYLTDIHVRTCTEAPFVLSEVTFRRPFA